MIIFTCLKLSLIVTAKTNFLALKIKKYKIVFFLNLLLFFYTDKTLAIL